MTARVDTQAIREPVEIIVPGTAVPQGSKRVVPTAVGPRAVESNAVRLVPWRAAVAAAAAYAMDGAEALSGPVRVDVVFTFARPLNHYGTGRNADALKASSPLWRAQAPDVDKLLRGVFDSLSGIVFRDDAQVADVRARKLYGAPCARITVYPLKGTP